MKPLINRVKDSYNKSITITSLNLLSLDGNKEVQLGVAQHDKIENIMIERLTFSPFWEVRKLIAMNPKTNGLLLNILSKDTRIEVIESVVKNKNTETKTLNYLFKYYKHKNKKLSCFIQKRINSNSN